MKKCVSCKENLPKQFVFCPKCGAPILQPTKNRVLIIVGGMVILIGGVAFVILSVIVGGLVSRVSTPSPIFTNTGAPITTSSPTAVYTQSSTRTPEILTPTHAPSSTKAVSPTLKPTNSPSPTQTPTNNIVISGDWEVELLVRDVVAGEWREEVGAKCSMTDSVIQFMYFSQSSDGSLDGYYYFPSVGSLAAAEYDFAGRISGDTFSVTSYLQEGCSGAEVVFQGVISGNTFQGTKSSLSRAHGDCCVFVGTINGIKQ